MLGLESTVSIGLQASAADPATLNRQALNIYGISGGQTEDDTDDNILGGGLANESDPVAPAPGLDDHAVTVRFPLCIAQAGYWFAAFFGAETASGAPSDYTHLWKSGQTLPYIFLEHRLKSGRYRRHWALVGESLEIDLDAERAGFGMGTVTFRGLKETTATAALAGTVTAAPALDRPAQKLVSVIYNAVAGGDLMGGKFKFTRNLKRLRGGDGTGIPYAIEIDGISQLEGSVRLRYHDDTFVDDGVAKTQRSFELDLMKTPTRGLQFELEQMRLNRTPIAVDGPDGVEYEMAFRGWQNATEPALKARVLNASATLVLPPTP